MIAQPPAPNSWVCAHCHRLVPAGCAHKCLEYDRYVEGGTITMPDATVASIAEALTQVEADIYALQRARREADAARRSIEPKLTYARNRRGELSQQLLELIAAEGERRADEARHAD